MSPAGSTVKSMATTLGRGKAWYAVGDMLSSSCLSVSCMLNIFPFTQAQSFEAVKVIGVRGHKGSLADADAESRMALAAYRQC